jgi:uncharacterized protein (DUF1800 family)
LLDPSEDLGDAESPPPASGPVEEGVDETGPEEMEAYRGEPWFREPQVQPPVEYGAADQWNQPEPQATYGYAPEPAYEPYQPEPQYEPYQPGPAYEAEPAYGYRAEPAYEPQPYQPEPPPEPAVATALPRIGTPDGKGGTRSKKKRTYTRRGVLAGAVAGGAAVAAARLLILEKPEVLAHFSGGVVDLSDHHGRLHNAVLDAPVKPQAQVVTQVVKAPGSAGFPLISEPLKISQLLRRLAFGGSDALFQQANQQGFQRTVDQLLATAPVQPPPFKGGESLQAKMNVNLSDLEDWWITHMVTTPTPFQERLTVFMAGIFTSDYQKVGLDNPFLVWQNRTWRDMALTDLRSILKRVSIDPAMLVYLDGNGSDGRGTPNQNYARELMELFSIGLVYAEQDVREGAKALSGWRVPKATDSSQVGLFDPNRHFAGPVAFLGRNQPMDVDGVIDAILAHPACAPFIASKFVNEFVTSTPDPAYIGRLAANFRKSGYQIKTLLHDVLTSPEFAAQANFRALVKSPLDFMVGAARLTGADPRMAVPIIRDYSRLLGHEPFNPPDVGGWPSNASWLSPISLMNRVNFVTDFTNALKGVAAPAQVVTRFLDGILSPGTNQTLAQAQTDLARWWSLIASPDAQLA